jgi:hypothetical protein
MDSSQYRIYQLDGEGRIALARGVSCPDDLAALAEAEYHSAGHPVEVWQGARLVARVKADNLPLDAADPTSL